jgi:hypothetical protein
MSCWASTLRFSTQPTNIYIADAYRRGRRLALSAANLNGFGMNCWASALRASTQPTNINIAEAYRRGRGLALSAAKPKGVLHGLLGFGALRLNPTYEYPYSGGIPQRPWVGVERSEAQRVWHGLLGFGASRLNPTYELSSALHRRRGFSREKHQPHELIAAKAPPTGFICGKQ